MGLEAMMVATTMISAGGAIYSGIQQDKAAKANAELLRRHGEADKDAAVAQAEKIRKAARYQAGQANAALAASGVDVGAGTALRINEDIYQNSEGDAYSALLTGTRRQRAASDEGAILRHQGRAAKIGGFLQAGGSVLSMGARASGWKAAAAAPIVERSSYAAS